MADKVLVHNHEGSWQKMAGTAGMAGTAEAVLAEQVPELGGEGSGRNSFTSFPSFDG